MIQEKEDLQEDKLDWQKRCGTRDVVCSALDYSGSAEQILMESKSTIARRQNGRETGLTWGFLKCGDMSGSRGVDL